MHSRFFTRTCAPVVLAAISLLGLAHPASAAAPLSDHALLMQLAAQLDADDAEIAQLQAQLADRPTAAAQPNATTTTYGPFTVTGKNVTLSGYNLYINSGSGSTSGTVNGTGNLVIGYDETSSGTNTRTGSHNLVLGTQNNYSSYGCIVGGLENNANGPDVAILGGRKNTASGHAAVIVGGENNNTSGTYSVIGGKTDETTSTSDIFLPESKDISNVQSQVTSLQTQATGLQTQVSSIQTKLQPMSTAVVTVPGNDGRNHEGYLVTFTNANVQIVNGLGATDGEPSNPEDVTDYVTNGFGNLIIGYNETQASLDNGATDTRTGSHNLILGDYNEYSGFGGMVGGSFDTLGGAYCGIVSGSYNQVGTANTAILGGAYNVANSNYYATVSGGGYNNAEGAQSSISGGYNCAADGVYSSVSGGYGCSASGQYSSVSGGLYNSATNSTTWAGGGYGNTASGDTSSISGGYFNTASGHIASVSGGTEVSEPNEDGWAAGTYESH